jgi:hypothetical protein
MNPILKRAVQVAAAERAAETGEAVAKAWKRFKNSPRQRSSDWSNAYQEKTLRGDRSPVNNKKYEQLLGPSLDGYKPVYGTSGYKEYFANPKTQRKQERREAAKRMKASLGAGQRIVNGNLRRQGSYSPKRFQFTP